jgi:hypothetical protein
MRWDRDNVLKSGERRTVPTFATLRTLLNETDKGQSLRAQLVMEYIPLFTQNKPRSIENLQALPLKLHLLSPASPAEKNTGL